MARRHFRKRSRARGINSLLHEPVSTPQDSSLDRAVSSLEPSLFLSFTLSLFPPPSICEPARYLPVPLALPLPETRIVYRLKNFIIRSRFSFVFQFDFYRAAPGKRQVRNVVPFLLRDLPIPLRRSPPPAFHLLAPIFNFELSSPT